MVGLFARCLLQMLPARRERVPSAVPLGAAAAAAASVATAQLPPRRSLHRHGARFYCVKTAQAISGTVPIVLSH
jgi:hypothetical protein